MTRYADHTDMELLRLLEQDDTRAFEAIYHRYAPDLNRFACRKTGDRDTSAEIIQELFVTLWTGRRELPQIGNLRTYLFQAAKNRILNYFRAAKVRERYAESFARFAAIHSREGEEQLAVEELRRSIDQGLAGLPKKCQRAFRLSRFHHMELPGIAREMSISQRTVENYISQALRHLRKKFGSG